MPRFSKKSLSKLETCDKRLQDLFLRVVKKFDCTIIEGHRSNDRERFTYFAGYVVGIAYQMGLKIRWGGDWDMDTQVKDNNFDDLPHFEIRDA